VGAVNVNARVFVSNSCQV